MNAPFRSRFGNTLTRFIMGAVTGQKLGDTQSGLRGIPLPFIPMLLKLRATGYDFELDMLLKCKDTGRQILLQRASSRYNGSFVTETGFTSMAEIPANLRALTPAIEELPIVLRYDRKKGASKTPVARTVGRSLNLLWRG